MSCSSCCCCCEEPCCELLDGIRKTERLVTEEEEDGEEAGGGGEEEESRRKMDISLLREQYKWTRERQKRHTQVILFRTVSEELSDAVSVLPISPGLTASPWEPNSSLPPAITFDTEPTTYDPWHAHLGLHRRRCPKITVQHAASPPETTNANSSSRCSSSSSESVRSRQDSTSDLPGNLREISPCWTFNCTKEEDLFSADRSRGNLDTESCERSRGDPEKVDPAQVSGSLDALEQNPCHGSKEVQPHSSFSEFSATSSLRSSGESSTPVASVTCSPSSSTTSLHKDLKENHFTGRKISNGFLQNSSASACRGSRKFSAPALRFTRQLSVGGVGSSVGIHQGHNYHPFPSRKTPRISEAARRLGMYSSF